MSLKQSHLKSIANSIIEITVKKKGSVDVNSALFIPAKLLQEVSTFWTGDLLRSFKIL